MQWNTAGAEPIGDFANVLFAVGVVQVLPRPENLNRLGPTLDQFIQQAGMQPLFYIHVCRDRLQHVFNFPNYGSRRFGEVRLARTSEASLQQKHSQIKMQISYAPA